MQLSTQDLLSLFIREGEDWSAKAIHTALESKGVDVASMERIKGVRPGAIRNVFYRKCPAYQQEIADLIGVPPSVIWPSRYQGKNTDSKAA
ncbi:transcriptional regulator [Salmonella enterica]|uniref:Transcriptional regulator n=1 Tax=Salmonella enterica subsp. enterica serovar Rough O:d:1,7 TaxID=1974323 RepID=A0A974QDJ8_SALET|nr:helix-turn-helix domain-containing protein [Salmonella enterica]EBP9561127.1 transcriptional regulator [Salmonella enterica subsp. enterica]ECI2309581.1 transcriptional regulator [Salmonella enterica subsp. enterica serovar Infantis]EAT1445995.1 transcriptional regulator [Salmonella enterica]EBC6510078.1 transcriptional regulator [Salmonella enterica]EBD6542189.1 transcriptional regulator [Salmonella enterica]